MFFFIVCLFFFHVVHIAESSIIIIHICSVRWESIGSQGLGIVSAHELLPVSLSRILLPVDIVASGCCCYANAIGGCFRKRSGYIEMRNAKLKLWNAELRSRACVYSVRV